jgi:hypothetical protein
MPFVMKSSQNGFVDAASKTIRFPGRIGLPPNLDELLRRAVFAPFSLDAFSLGSLPASAHIVNIRRESVSEPQWVPDVLNRPSVDLTRNKILDFAYGSATGNADFIASLSVDFFQYTDSGWNTDIPREGSVASLSSDFRPIEIVSISDQSYYQAIIFAPSNSPLFASSGFGDVNDVAPDNSDQGGKVRTITISEHASNMFLGGIDSPFDLTARPRRRRQAA